MGDFHRTGRGPKRRLHHQRVVDVAPLHGERSRRRQSPVPGLRIKQPTEDCRCIEAGHAPPVDRPAAVNQCRAVAVGQEAVVTDPEFWLGHTAP